MGRARELANLFSGGSADINVKTSDGGILNLQSSDTTITSSSVLGAINFQAPDEASGTDSILLGAGIDAVAEGTFSASSNATKISFKTASSEAASEKMSLSSAGLLTVSGRIITDDTTEATSTTDGSLQTDGGLSVAKDIVAGDDVKLLSDSAVLSFGADSEIQLIHVADDGLILKHIGTGDGKEPSFTFQAGDNDIAQDDVLGQINFQAPDEGAGTDAIVVASTIKAFSEGDFSASSNATTLELAVGRSAAAGSDGGRLRLTSAGVLELKNQNTADDSKPIISLQAGDTDIAQDDELGSIIFKAPDEGTGTDAILTAAAIAAQAEGDFSSSSNATSLVFATGSSEAATTKMILTSLGQLKVQNEVDNNYIAEFQNTEATDGRSFGMRIKAGSNASDQSFVIQDHDASNTLFKITGDGDVNIGIGDILFGTSGKGINLGVTSNTDSNTLDDYEEGTFTLSVGTNYSGTYSSIQYTYYTKVGQQVFYGMRISGRSNTSDSSQVNFTGFPFAVYAEHAAAVGMNDDEFGHAMVNTAETLYFYNLSGGDFQYSQWPHTSGYARVQGSYRIA